MMSLPEIIKYALKGGTKERAKELVDQQVDEMVSILHYDADMARGIVLHNIGYYTGYLDHETADKVMELFNTEHPYFGRKHPSHEEIVKMVMELGRKQRSLIDDQASKS
jgi:ferric iron reductase protein FhuF